MFIAWIVLGYSMFASKRYLGFLGMVGMYIHALCGYAILILTLLSGIKAIQRVGTIKLLPHGLFGLAMLILVPIATFSGSGIMMLGKPFNKIERWQSPKAEASYNLKKFHKLFGFAMLALGVITSTMGFWVY